MDTIIVIMEKNLKTGFLEREIAGLSLSENQKYIVNIYAAGDSLCIKLSDDRELEDWEFEAVYDYFDTEVFGGRITEISEEEDTYNPTWKIELPFDENNTEGLEERVEEILDIFKKELSSVYEVIKDKKGEYYEGQ